MAQDWTRVWNIFISFVPPILKKSRVRPWMWQLFLLLVVKLLQVRPACVHDVPRPNFLPQARYIKSWIIGCSRLACRFRPNAVTWLEIKKPFWPVTPFPPPHGPPSVEKISLKRRSCVCFAAFPAVLMWLPAVWRTYRRKISVRLRRTGV